MVAKRKNGKGVEKSRGVITSMFCIWMENVCNRLLSAAGCSLDWVWYWFCQTVKFTFILGYYSSATGAHATKLLFSATAAEAFVGRNQFSCRLSKAGFSLLCVCLRGKSRGFGDSKVCVKIAAKLLFFAHFFFWVSFLSRHDLWVFHSNPFRLLIIERIDFGLRRADPVSKAQKKPETN